MSSRTVLATRVPGEMMALTALFMALGAADGQTDTTVGGRRPFVGRILGAFDLTTGQPVEGVEVMDLVSKTSALTTVTGTVALSFVDIAGSVLSRISGSTAFG